MVTVPKHDFSAEQSILWCMIIDNLCVWDIVTQITSDYFYEKNHKLIYKSIAYLHSLNIPIDLVTLKSQLEKLNVLESIWVLYLVELTEVVPITSNYQSYLDIVKDKYYLREAMSIAYHIQDKIKQNHSIDDILSYINDASRNLVQSQDNLQSETLQTILSKRYEEVADIVENWILDSSIKTWYKELDDCLWWLQEWNLVIVAWRPAMWKTAFALNVQDNVLKTWKRCAFFSLEMSEREIADRILSIYSDINAFCLRTWKVTESDLQKIAEVYEKLQNQKLEIDAMPTITPDKLRNKIIKLTRNEKLDLIIVDYLQLIKVPWESNRVNEVSEISRQLKLIAKEFKCPVIALSQLSRAVESRPDKRPNMSDLRDSWSIEQDADQIMFIYRDEYYNEFTDKPNIVDILLKKNRHWSIRDVWLYFDKPKQRMYNIDPWQSVTTVDGKNIFIWKDEPKSSKKK